MHTSSNFHLTKGATIDGAIRKMPDGRPYLVLTIRDEGGEAVFFPRNPEFLDKLSNEADRLCREFVGDVPQPEALP